MLPLYLTRTKHAAKGSERTIGPEREGVRGAQHFHVTTGAQMIQTGNTGQDVFEPQSVLDTSYERR